MTTGKSTRARLEGRSKWAAIQMLADEIDSLRTEMADIWGASLAEPTADSPSPRPSATGAGGPGTASGTTPTCGSGGVVSSPDVLGGEPRVDGTRIPVRAVRSFYEDGYTNDQIVKEYPTLTKWQVHNALMWSFAHTTSLPDDEISRLAEVARNAAQYDGVMDARDQWVSNWPEIVRAVLDARR